MRFATPPFILDISLFFFCVGLCSRGTLSLQDTGRKEVHRIRTQSIHHVDAESTGSAINHVRLKDLSERDQWHLKQHMASSNFNRAIHLDATMEIGWRDWRDHEIVVHDHHAVVAHNHHVIVAINRPSPNETAQIFLAESPYKMMFFPL